MEGGLKEDIGMKSQSILDYCFGVFILLSSLLYSCIIMAGGVVMKDGQEPTPVIGESKGQSSLGPYTYEDYAALPEESGYRYELIDGFLLKEPSPEVHHQRVSRRLHRILEDYFATTRPQGETFYAPLDVIFSPYSAVQPDILFIADIRQLADAKFIKIAPELVVEVLSPASRRKDRIRKLDLYLRQGVLHYWIVDPEEGTIEAYRLQDNMYVLVQSTDQEFAHPDFPGLSFNIAVVTAKPGS
jgi:Uma2 family endonuclease